MAVVNELAAIPFGYLIGAPLSAAIEAQAKAAMTTVEFIRAVGLTKEGEIINVKFLYKNGPEDTDLMELQVPLLTIVPIPFLRIENMDIHFKASLSQSMETSDKVSSSIGASVTTGVSSSWFVKASLNATVSSKKDTSSTRDSRYAVEYTMDINVHAVQDDMPGGLAKILNLLNESMDHTLKAAPESSSGGGAQKKPTQPTPEK
jgi:hypothetical protein